MDQGNQRKRLIFWGPGHIGGAVLREVLKSPDKYEVVGARVYNPDKHGRDVGELVGVGPIGVRATTDPGEILALDADCVVFTPLPLDHEQITKDAVALLCSGKNVVTTTTFHYPQMHGPEYVELLQDACHSGEVTLHGTGIHPSFMAERLVLTLTGLFTDVRHIRLAEACESSKALHEMSPEFLSVIGFGQPLDTISSTAMGALLVNPYYHGVMGYVADALFGAAPQQLRFEHDHFGIAADRDYHFPNVTIREGTALTLVHVHRGYIGDHHFFTNEEYYYVGAENRSTLPVDPPFGPYAGDANYAVDVTGDPFDLRLQLDLRPTRDDTVPAITYLSVVPLLQSIELTVNAAPGLLHPRVAPHFRASAPA
ncbi:hypothetical protein ACPCIR_26185 [Mycobacterium sp. NPDC051198]